MKSNKLVAIAIGISFLIPSTAYAGGGGGIITGAMETTQLRNESELISANATFIKQLSQQVDQLKTQIQMWTQMAKNAIPLSVTDTYRLINDLRELSDIATDVNGLYHGSSDMQLYLDNEYKSLAKIDSYKNASELSNLHSDLKKKNQNTLRATAKLTDALSKQTDTRATAIENAVKGSRNAKGTQQALQAANELAAHTASELVSLNRLTQLQLERMTDKDIQRQMEEEAFRKQQQLMFQQKSTDGMGIKFDDIKFND